ncbi:hypothetical protein N8724_01420 [Candidatus Pelagibacter sp.]|nr:hypothetical protein [Candidatus Pelagibacter sp.]
MAIGFSKKMQELAYKNLYGTYYSLDHKNKISKKIINKFLVYKLNIYIYVINKFRRIIRKFLPEDKDLNESINIETNIAIHSEKIKKSINENGYVFLENFISNDFYIYLKNNYPKIYHFEKVKKPQKNFDIGFKYKSDIDSPEYYLESSTCLKHLYKFINSKKFQVEINKIFFDDTIKLFNYSIIASYAKKGSFLIPHKDSKYSETKDMSLNFIYFIDGNDDNIKFSGGTSFFKDNNLKETLLRPTTLKNSLLIYDNVKNFYHGFEVMKKNCFRKAITFTFYRY